MSKEELENGLAQIGKGSMQCGKSCEGVRSQTEEGIRPRYMMISSPGDRISCVIISLAPPRTTLRDRRLLAQARGYKDILGQYRDKIESTTFYRKLNTFRAKLELEDSAAWTTLCKCERIKGKKLPPETIQECVGSHLAKELELVDKSVPIIAVGNRVFTTISHSFPERFVLNVPSPDGPRRDFQKTVDNEKLLKFAKARMAEGKPGALCLCPLCARRHLMSD